MQNKTNHKKITTKMNIHLRKDNMHQLSKSIVRQHLETREVKTASWKTTELLNGHPIITNKNNGRALSTDGKINSRLETSNLVIHTIHHTHLESGIIQIS